MKRFGGLFDEIASTRNLWRGWREFRRGKRKRPSVRAFELRSEREVMMLHREITGGEYRGGGYRLRFLHEPKKRLISAADVRDRVVHHAVHRVLAPRLDPGLIESTYACLKGRGSHRAILALVAALRRYRFLLELDARHYFLSVDREILIGDVMERRIKDRRVLELLAAIAGSGAGLYHHPGVPEFLELEPGFPPPGRGLPIGNLTSQWWGNHYLSGIDHFIKRQLRIPHYQRYMDDLTLASNSRQELVEAREAVAEWLWTKRRLRLKAPDRAPRSTRGHFDYLGYRVSRAGIRPRRELVKRMRDRMRELVLVGPDEKVERSAASYRGIVGFGQPGGGVRVNE